MASNFLSRLLPPANGTPSVYETLREYDEASVESDVEERAGMALDEENLGDNFHDYELDQALADAAESQLNTGSGAKPEVRPGRSKRAGGRSGLRSIWQQSPLKKAEADELDDEVPQSLLVEGQNTETLATEQHRQVREGHDVIPPPVSGLPSRGTRARWHATQEQQRLHQELDRQPGRTKSSHVSQRSQGLAMIDPKEKAMWRWANVENLDNFLREVYDYFLGNGIWCILLGRILNLL